MKREAPSGYSGTPLSKKLGIKAGTQLCAIDAPDEYLALISPLPEAVKFVLRPSASTDLIHLFATQRNELRKRLEVWRSVLKPTGAIWVSWPKKSAKGSASVPTDITEDVIREIALPLGLVDVKVCSVNETWSGLKLVIRKQYR